MVVCPGEATAENAFDDQVIGRSGRADPNSKVEFPLWPQVDIDGREELLLLIPQGIETVQRSVSRVILKPATDPFGEIEAHFCVWRERIRS